MNTREHAPTLMQHLPVFAAIENRACLVVGGGSVALRRVKLLLAAGAKITVMAPELSPSLQAFADRGEISADLEKFADQGLDDYWLIIAATDDPDTNSAVARAAREAHRFCNVVDDPDQCSFIMPTIIDRDPVTIAISSGGASPVLARSIKGFIESLLPSRLGDLAQLAKRWRQRVKNALPNLENRRKFWQSVLIGEVADHAYAGRRDEGDAALARALERWQGDHPEQAAGEAYLVGAGPGARDLMTLRGRQLLASADTVLYDRLVHPGILEYARRDAEFVSVGKTPGRASITQAEINTLLVDLVAAGKKVCRLKGGDPMIFGRAGEELEALANAGLRFQIVPGVSAIEGCAAYAGIPLTLRGVAQSVLITTGHSQTQTPKELGRLGAGQTIAFYMGVAHYREISANLLANGLVPQTPVAVIENGTTESQRVIRTTLARLHAARTEHRIEAPALLLVGDTTAQAEAFSWFAPGQLIQDDDAQTTLARVS